MATDIIFHRFYFVLDSIWGWFLVLKSEKMDTKKHSKNIPAKKSRRPSREIWAWVLWSLKTIQRSQIQGLANLTQGLETLHWCLAARWRISGKFIIFLSSSPQNYFQICILISTKTKRTKKQETRQKHGTWDIHVSNIFKICESQIYKNDIFPGWFHNFLVFFDAFW